MRRILLVATIVFSSACRATLPTTVHNPTAGFAAEMGPLYGFGVEDEAKEVTTDDKEKLKSEDGAGFVSLLQTGPFYMKIDAAPLPGTWIGAGLTDAKPGKFGWYPAIEVASTSEKSGEETSDGYLEDSGGNRYLYEVKRSRSEWGLAIPQLWEWYPAKKMALYFAATPTFINTSSETTVSIVYENDRRLVQADPVLDAKFRDIQTYEGRNDENINRTLMPLTLGFRFQIKSFGMRFAYVTRRVDSVKNYDSSFRDVALFTIGYASAPKPRSYSPSPQPSSPSPPPPQQNQGTTTTTTTTTGPNGTTTTTTTTTNPAPAPRQETRPAPQQQSQPGIQIQIPLNKRRGR
jgi:hypothetical protein